MAFLLHKLRGMLRYMRAHGGRAMINQLLNRPNPIRLNVEAPLDNGYTLGGVTVRGWAYSTQSDIRHIEAIHRGKVIATLRHLLPRPDVSDYFNFRGALYSGFEGRFKMPPGRHTITIRAVDAEGAAFQTHLRLNSEHTPPAMLEVEKAIWRGGILTVEGWALWVGSERPRIVRYLLDGRIIGTSRCTLSRPEISGRYSPDIAADCKGFFFESTLPFAGKNAELLVQITERSGRTLEHKIMLQHEDVPSHSVNAALEQVIALYRAAVNPDCEILDWHTGRIGSGLAGYNLFTPPSKDALTLPYFDDSIGIVAIANEAQREEARRVARVAVVFVADPFAVEWKSGHAPALPSISIIIPVYNHAADTRACLDQLRKTISPYFVGEIIIADDASTDETPSMIAAYASDWPLIKIVRGEQNGGFIVNCNRGAAAATGDYLLFLNNDTLPQTGWLDALLFTFRRYPDAGAVGGKLINSDGTLQEAGAVVLPDGRTMQFGADDPAINHPLYRHVREVDYCSGALLMTPRALFERIGGFDARFHPAYFEDVDYCFSVRAQGYKVYFQPESHVIHAAHVSYGDFLQRMEPNRRHLAEKWGEALAQMPEENENPYTVVDGKRRKRALFYGNRMPEFDRFGGLLRFHYLINALADEGWAVTFYARDITGGERYADLLRQRGIMVYGGDLSRGIDDNYMPDPVPLLLASQFDLAVLSLWQTAEPLLPLLHTHSPATRIIVDSSDVHFIREARAQFSEQAKLDDVFARGMTGELNVYAAADAMLAVSENEANIVNNLIGQTEHAYVVPNMIQTTPSPVAFGARRGMVFIGNYIYPPNIEAVTYLIEQILPLCPPELLAEHPVYIIGHNAQKALGAVAQQNPHVRLVGWLPDVSPYLQKSRVTVVPLLNGAGTKTKLITALANRTPAVSTWIGAEGLGLQHGRDVLIADNAAAFAGAIEQILTDEPLWNRLAEAGFAHIEATHGYAFGKRRFTDVIKTVFRRSGSGLNIPTPVSRSSR